MRLDVAFTQIRSRRELLHSGVDHRALERKMRSGEWMRIRHEVYAPTAWWRTLHPVEAHQAMAVALNKVSRVPVIFTHETAALLHGLPLLEVPQRLHVLFPSGKGAKDPRICGHSTVFGSESHHLRGSLRVTSPRGTLVDCARFLPVRSSLLLVEAALWKARTGEGEWWQHLGPQGLHLQKALRSVTGRGAARCREIAASMSAFSESPGETLTLHLLRERRLAPPRQQLRVGRRRVDFAWEEQKVILEFDGMVKYTGEDRWREEKSREVELQQQGWTVIRTVWSEVLHSPDGLIQRLLAAGVPMA